MINKKCQQHNSKKRVYKREREKYNIISRSTFWVINIKIKKIIICIILAITCLWWLRNDDDDDDDVSNK